MWALPLVWFGSSMAAYLYSRQYHIPLHLTLAALPAFLLEASFYYALGVERWRRTRVAIELDMAQVLLSRTTRWQDALDALRPVLHETPGDASARALASQLLAHRTTRAGAIEMLEQACDASDDAAVKEQILTRLLDAPADADDSSAGMS